MKIFIFKYKNIYIYIEYDFDKEIHKKKYRISNL